MTTVSKAAALFADSDADIILRASIIARPRGQPPPPKKYQFNPKFFTDFRVHRFILAKASPIFADMFSLPSSQSLALGNDSDDEDGIPVVRMSEDTMALRFMLDFCYHPFGAPFPALSSVQDVKLALHLSDKFEISGLKAVALEAMPTLVKTSAEQAFAIAWMYKLPDIALSAARQSLLNPLSKASLKHPEFAEIPGTAILELFHFQRECVDRARGQASNLGWLVPEACPAIWDIDSSGPPPIYVAQCADYPCNQTKREVQVPPAGEGSFTHWRLLPWMHAYLVEAELRLQTCPRGEAVEAYDAWRGALQKLSEAPEDMRCTSCMKSAFSVLPALAKLLSKRVEQVIMEVSLDLPF